MNERLKVLLIAATDGDSELLAGVLRRGGFDPRLRRVARASDFRCALDDADWDLILADWRLPDLDALQALQILQAKGLEVPLIIFSSQASDEAACDLMKAGARDFVSRRDLARLVPVIERELRESWTRGAKLRAEQALRESELRYRSLVESSPVPIAVHSIDERIVYLNNAAIHALGGHRWADLAGRSIWEFIDASQRPLIRRLERRLMSRPQQSVTREIGIHRLDGAALEVEAVATLVEYQGQPAVQVLFTDISQRKLAESRLRQAAAVFESSSEGVIITDADVNIVAVNKAFTEITGYSEQQVLGNNPRLLKSGRHGRMFYESMWRSLRENGTWQGEVWNRRRGGEVYPEHVNIRAVADESGQIINYVAVFSDITQIKQSQAQLQHLAHYDALTDLPNRLLFLARLGHALERARRDGRRLAVLFLGLDRFQTVNDTLGHPAGDLLLQQVAQRLSQQVREYDTLARLGGDEFTLLLEYLDDPQEAAGYAQEILEGFAKPYRIGERELYLSASLGIALYPSDGDDVETLTKHADVAMHRAKDQGRNNYQFFTAEMTSNAFERFFIETHLRHSLSRGEMVLHFQPQVSLETNRIEGAEALVRWEHPDMGVISPTQFIPMAEENGLIVPIGEWVLRTACQHIRAWLDAGLLQGQVAVNLSGRQIQRLDLFDAVTRVLEETGCPAEHLQLEVTEGFIMEESEHSIQLLRALRDLGIALAIDDFGTGYSSLSYLKRLPIHKLKIDKSFVQGIPDDPDDEAIVRAIISMGTSLGLGVIAEGVETEAQRKFLRREGCDQVQGFLFSRPVPSSAFAQLLTAQQPSPPSPALYPQS